MQHLSLAVCNGYKDATLWKSQLLSTKRNPLQLPSLMMQT